MGIDNLWAYVLCAIIVSAGLIYNSLQMLYNEVILIKQSIDELIEEMHKK